MPAQPIQLEEFITWQDHNGQMLLKEAECRRRIFQRGVAVSARKVVWPYLLGVYLWDSTKAERDIQMDTMQSVPLNS